MNDADKVCFLKQLVRCRSISDGAKVTLIEFLTHFWTTDRKLPSYSELCEIRGIARSTVQLHITELETSGILQSMRLPNNRKRYVLVYSALGVKEKKTATAKPKGKYRTDELVTYFYQLLFEMTGEKRSASRSDYASLKEVHRNNTAVAVIEKMEYFRKYYRKRRWGSFTIGNFIERCFSV